MNRKTRNSILWVALLLIASIWIIVQHQKKAPYRNINGFVFGTVYNITYQSNDSLQLDIEDELRKFDASLSMFNDTSVISKINQNKPVVVDSLFEHCFKRSMEISQMTKGDFDVTVCPLVNAWGFGFKSKKFPNKKQIDSLLQYVGYQKVKLVNHRLIKSNPNIMLDFSAIAKGYAVDVVSYFLDKRGIRNYMVDIGGEVVIRGKNPQNKLWRIGINKPIDDSLSVNQEIDKVMNISNKAIATSGNYRNFYYYKGKKYSHEINPHNGFPALTDVLSSTVITSDCMSADAFATAIMVMGLKKSQSFLRRLQNVDAYIIYRDEKGKNQIYYSPGMNKYFNNK